MSSGERNSLKRTDKLIYIASFMGEMHMHVEKYEQEGAKKKTGSLSSFQLNKWIIAE